MSEFGEFMERIFKINQSSAKYASNFQRVNEEIISKVDSVGVRSVNPLLEFILKLKRQMIGLLPFSFATDLMPLLRPIFEAFSSEFENEVVSNLESFRLSIFWRFKPLTDIIDKVVGRLGEDSRRILLDRRQLSTYSIQPKIYPIHSEEVHEISDHVGQISRFGYIFFPRTPKLTIKLGVDYGDYDTIGEKVTSEVETKDVKVPLEVPLEVPIISLTPNFVRVRRNAVDVLEKGMATKLFGGKLSEAYIHRVDDWTRASSATFSQISDIGKFYFSIPVIKRGLQLLSTGGVGAYITELQSVALSPFRYVEERSTESPIVGYPPRISSKLGYYSLKLAPHIFTDKSSSESVSRYRLQEIETILKEVLGRLFRVHRSSPLISRRPSITRTSKIDRDHRGEFDVLPIGYPETSIAALATIAPSVLKVYSDLVKPLLLPTQLTDLDESKYVSSLSEMGRYSRIMTEKVAKSSVFRTHLHPVVKTLHSIITKLGYSTATTRVGYPSTGFRMVEKLPMEEYYELGKRFDAISESDHAFPLILDGFRQLSSTTSRSYLQPSLVKMAEAVSNRQPIKLNLSVLDAFWGVTKEIVDRETGVQRALQLSLGGAISDMMVVERNALERFPLDAPVNVPTLKLQEIISRISSVQPPTEREMPTRIKRDRLSRTSLSRSIEVTIDSLRDESDIRELERKITRILREEARRYGLI